MHDGPMGLVQVAQRAQDLDRAAAFYADLLGRPPTARFDPPGLLFFDLDGVRLLLDVERAVRAALPAGRRRRRDRRAAARAGASSSSPSRT